MNAIRSFDHTGSVVYRSCALAVVLCLLLGCTDPPPSTSPPDQTEISGTIGVDTTWSPISSPYYVLDDVTVEEDVTLSIQPGVKIIFMNNSGLIVKGMMIADGASSDSLITFTSGQEFPKPGDWKGILFKNTNNDKSQLRYTKVEYGEVGVDCFSSSPRISDCIITSNNTGIRTTDVSQTMTLEHNLISNNIVGLVFSRQTPIVTSNTITKNDMGVVLYSKWLSAEGNNFAGNLGYAIMLKNTTQGGSKGANAQRCWWATLDEERINQMLFDRQDDSRLGSIHYQPPLEEKIVEAAPR